MWILESGSELFQGRRMWLKPGKQYLFGRVKKDGVRFAIDNKTVSRKHFIIRIDEPRIEDVGNVHVRTKATIEDQGSKAGTTVNGEHIKGSSRELENAENYIKPGTLPEDLVIKWLPCVLTYNLLKKEAKAGVLKTKQERVKDLDVKAVSEYVAGQTTHLVVNKRNTPKSLQALIDGRYLVAESYIDALEYAATPSDLNEEENLSPLEQDFDSAWPDPNEHLPPPGRELTKRPAKAYQPDPERRHVFQKFTFVFLDQTQYDNLLPPITTGHGKAQLYKIVPGDTTSADIVTYLRNAAGKKGFGDDRNGSEKGGVILVRYKGDSGNEEWTDNLINETSLALDQRAIDQGEFLEAILANDGTKLRQTIPYDSNHESDGALPGTGVPLASTGQLDRDAQARRPGSHAAESYAPASLAAPQSDSHLPLTMNGHQANSTPSSDSAHDGADQTQQSARDDDTTRPTKRARFMVPKKSRVFDFDDDFDPDSVPLYQEEDEQASNVSESQVQQRSTPSLPPQNPDKDERKSSRKRPRSPSQDASIDLDEDDDMDEFLPAVAAMKRRKLAEGTTNGTVEDPAKKRLVSSLAKKPKLEKDINVREHTKAQLKAEDDRAQKEEDDLDEEFRLQPGQHMPVYDVETVIIDLPTRHRPVNVVDSKLSDRWDPKWNGRKNFKGFRRARDTSNGEGGLESRRRNHTRVIVPLVDAKTATYGMGDQYWDKTQEEKDRERKKRASQRTTQSGSSHIRSSQQQRTQTVGDSDGDAQNEEHASDGSQQASPEVLRLQHEAAEIMDHSVNIDEPRRTRLADTQIENGTARGTKRVVANASRTNATKKQKTLPTTVVHGSDSDSDDSDDMKFKFGSRSRRGKGRA